MASQVNKQEDRHVEGSKRKQGKKETEGGQEPAQDPCVGLQGGARPGQAVLQPVREKDVKLAALARSGARFSATFRGAPWQRLKFLPEPHTGILRLQRIEFSGATGNGKRVENHNGDKALRWWAADEGIFPGCDRGSGRGREGATGASAAS